MGRRRTRVPNPKFSLRGVTHFSEFRIQKGRLKLYLRVFDSKILLKDARLGWRSLLNHRTSSRMRRGQEIDYLCNDLLAGLVARLRHRDHSWDRRRLRVAELSRLFLYTVRAAINDALMIFDTSRHSRWSGRKHRRYWDSIVRSSCRCRYRARARRSARAPLVLTRRR